jgi:hypothetical protein
MIQTAKTLLAVECYQLTGDEIGKLKSKYLNKAHFEENMLPVFCLDEDGHVRITYHWLEFIEDGNIVYRLFDALTADRLLDNEISEAGLDSLLEGVDLNQMYESLTVYGYDDFNRVLPNADYIAIELIYHTDKEESDSELETKVLGFLNKSLDFSEYKIQEDEE